MERTFIRGWLSKTKAYHKGQDMPLMSAKVSAENNIKFLGIGELPTL